MPLLVAGDDLGEAVAEEGCVDVLSRYEAMVVNKGVKTCEEGGDRQSTAWWTGVGRLLMTGRMDHSCCKGQARCRWHIQVHNAGIRVH
jgi:hypothetical protein|mmetsp:Transcript_16382/g.26701  ORF Transcript_16382/g.26701 Transcript_16382/m.26701 type:complete len:88 (+) Transcript_16382:142-405(+)